MQTLHITYLLFLYVLLIKRLFVLLRKTQTIHIHRKQRRHKFTFSNVCSICYYIGRITNGIIWNEEGIYSTSMCIYLCNIYIYIYRVHYYVFRMSTCLGQSGTIYICAELCSLCIHTFCILLASVIQPQLPNRARVAQKAISKTQDTFGKRG